MHDPAVVLALHSLLVDSILTRVSLVYDNDHPMQQACSILIQIESSYMRSPHIVITQTFTLVKLALYAYLLFHGAHFGQFGQIGNHWASRPNTTNNIKWRWAIECCQLQFSPTDPRCHGNEIWDKIDYNAVCVKDICEIFCIRGGVFGNGPSNAAN